jgi:hypothetical protein
MIGRFFVSNDKIHYGNQWISYKERTEQSCMPKHGNVALEKDVWQAKKEGVCAKFRAETDENVVFD